MRSSIYVKYRGFTVLVHSLWNELPTNVNYCTILSSFKKKIVQTLSSKKTKFLIDFECFNCFWENIFNFIICMNVVYLIQPSQIVSANCCPTECISGLVDHFLWVYVLLLKDTMDIQDWYGPLAILKSQYDTKHHQQKIPKTFGKYRPLFWLGECISFCKGIRPHQCGTTWQLPWSTKQDMQINVSEFMTVPITSPAAKDVQKNREQHWMYKLKSLVPLGINATDGSNQSRNHPNRPRMPISSDPQPMSP